MRRTVLYWKGETICCGHAKEPVGAADGPIGIDCPLGTFGLPSRS